jgi:hypothetical protein
VNNRITSFQTGAWIGSTDGLSVRNNTISDIAVDGMLVGHIHDAVISGNSITLDVRSGTKHTDGIQFYNTGTNDPMTNVMVQNNRIETNNTMSHGIYAANGIADSRGGISTFFKNVTIDHNTIVSAQVSGIAVGQTSGLKITNNILLQDTGFRSTSEIRTPLIRVEKDSTGVNISGNVTHRLPEASGDNWQPTHKSEPGWTISNNKIVSVGTSVKTAESLAPSAGASATSAAPSPAEAPPNSGSGSGSDGHSDIFRFYGDTKGGTRQVSLDFGDGDKMTLHKFAVGTFHDHAGGNYLQVSPDGAYAKIDSLADLRELDQASSKVSIHTSGDTLVLDIAQKGVADHVIELAGLGHAYADLI